MMPKVYLETSFLIIAVLLIYFLNLSSRTLQENIGYLAILAYGVQRILPQINNIYNLSINFRSVTPTVQNFLDILDGGTRKYNFDENNIKEKITFKNEIILKIFVIDITSKVQMFLIILILVLKRVRK